MRIAVIIASLGRPREIQDLLDCLAYQTRKPEQVVISVESNQDLPLCIPSWPDVVVGPRGASAQRNRGLALVSDRCDVVVFVDDDYVPSRVFLENIAALFSGYPEIVGATGLVLADGVREGGMTLEQARQLVEDYDQRRGQGPFDIADDDHIYGCNMAFRTSALTDARFDENLPLYSWQEDVDFGAQVRRFGRVVKTDAFAGVHRGVSTSRTSGVRFGYSQVVNPLYLVRKGTMRPRHAASLMVRNLLSNHIKSLAPPGHIDRRGRLRGNWIGILDLLRGGADPRRILEL